jgi:hypothetical protein
MKNMNTVRFYNSFNTLEGEIPQIGMQLLLWHVPVSRQGTPAPSFQCTYSHLGTNVSPLESSFVERQFDLITIIASYNLCTSWIPLLLLVIIVGVGYAPTGKRRRTSRRGG